MHKTLTLKAYKSTWVQTQNILNNIIKIQYINLKRKKKLKQKKNVKTLPLR